jgi:hypothetical protein
MDFVRIPARELDPEFGPKLLFSAYKKIAATSKRLETVVLISEAELKRLQLIEKNFDKELERVRAEVKQILNQK